MQSVGVHSDTPTDPFFAVLVFAPSCPLPSSFSALAVAPMMLKGLSYSLKVFQVQNVKSDFCSILSFTGEKEH